MSEARNHHWVPQVYLRGFATPTKKTDRLFVVDSIKRESFVTSTRNVAADRDFNRVEITGVDPNGVEKGYGDFEALVGNTIRRIISDRDIREESDLNIVLNLIALLAVRNPLMRENIRRGNEMMTKRAMDVAVSTEARFEKTLAAAIKAGAVHAQDEVSWSDIREFIEGDKYKVSMTTTSHVQHELRMVDTVLPLLGLRNWLVARASPGSGGFVTSDHPVMLQWTENGPHSRYRAPGFALRSTEVIFTLTNKIAMVGTFDQPSVVADLNKLQVALINGVVIANADRQIYAKDSTFSYLDNDRCLKRGIDALTDMPARAR